MSSLTNSAISIYAARTLGAADFGAFSLAYVTYSFALNASRGLGSDPLMVRFSGAELPVWRRAVSHCSGTAAVVGIVAALAVLGAAAALSGTARLAFLALGLTLPGLLLQDSWRYAFFAIGRGSRAFLNDLVWAAALVPALLFLRSTGRENVFWLVFAWGAAGTLAALVGPFQARVIPRLHKAREWVSEHRDLGPRYLAENTANSGAAQLRIYGIGIIVSLSAVGYIQASSTLMGPFMVIFMGLSLVTVPEAARVLRQSPQHLRLFCFLVGCALALIGFAWGVALIVALPRGLGSWLLGPIWRPAFPLVLPVSIGLAGACMTAGASAGLRALGQSRRSLRAQVIASVIYVAAGLVGGVIDGAYGSVVGTAIAIWIGTLMWWWQLHTALKEPAKVPGGVIASPARAAGRHRTAATASSRPRPRKQAPKRS